MSMNPPAAAARLASQFTASPAAITQAHRKARQEFDLDAALAALPSHAPTAVSSYQGGAGIRLRPHLVADISDGLLREFARDTLKAARMSEQYLDALRVVLGNQAEAERMGYVLEMNLRTSFAPVGIVRTIVNQMRRAGRTFGKTVVLGKGRSQVVQCFASKSYRHESAQAELAFLDRRDEEAAGKAPERVSAADPWCIPAGEVPY